MNIRQIISSISVLCIAMASCSKKENFKIETAYTQVGQQISDAGILTGSIKGTMISGKTYTIQGRVTVEEGDTLLIQEGVHVEVMANTLIVAKGTFLSVGTKANPIWFTTKTLQKQDALNTNINSDPAYKGFWGGIWFDNQCPKAVIKYTHLEYAGSKIDTEPVTGAGTSQRVIHFGNADGYLVFEDNWVYGLVANGLIIQGGKFNVMRNTFEKGGYTGGDMVSVTGNSIGNIAYNLFMGSATTGSKPSNAGGGSIRQCEVNTYNNTFINGGWRCTLVARGGSILYRQDARGKIFNNLMVNCRYGVRMDANRPDLANIALGYNYNYGENTNVTNEIYPVGHLTVPQETDIPYPWDVLSKSTYTTGSVYNGTAWVGKNDPSFVNFPLGNIAANFLTMAYVGSYDFRLTSNSPARNKGTRQFSPYDDNGKFPVDPILGSSGINIPSTDIGAFPYDNSGNQYYN